MAPAQPELKKVKRLIHAPRRLLADTRAVPRQAPVRAAERQPQGDWHPARLRCMLSLSPDVRRFGAGARATDSLPGFLERRSRRRCRGERRRSEGQAWNGGTAVLWSSRRWCSANSVLWRVVPGHTRKLGRHDGSAREDWRRRSEASMSRVAHGGSETWAWPCREHLVTAGRVVEMAKRASHALPSRHEHISRPYFGGALLECCQLRPGHRYGGGPEPFTESGKGPGTDEK